MADPRRFLREIGARYDLILIGMPEPSSGQANRFYTREFFRRVRRTARNGRDRRPPPPHPGEPLDAAPDPPDGEHPPRPRIGLSRRAAPAGDRHRHHRLTGPPPPLPGDPHRPSPGAADQDPPRFRPLHPASLHERPVRRDGETGERDGRPDEHRHPSGLLRIRGRDVACPVLPGAGSRGPLRIRQPGGRLRKDPLDDRPGNSAGLCRKPPVSPLAAGAARRCGGMHRHRLRGGPPALLPGEGRQSSIRISAFC